jgi:hypothetical protein
VSVFAVATAAAVLLEWDGSYRSRNDDQYYRPYRTVEGNVESFTVEADAFGYANLGRFYCFDRAADAGGPVRNGLPVPVSYAALNLGRCIERLEVAKDAPQ